MAVFTYVPRRVADAGLLNGATVGIEATTLEVNATLRTVVRRDTDGAYDTFRRRLAAASGIPATTRAERARLERKRRKKRSVRDWTYPKGPDAEVTKMKDRRTHLAQKAEHAVGLETCAVVALTVRDASSCDATTMVETLVTAAKQVEAVLPAVAKVVADKGCHNDGTMVALATTLGLRIYASKPNPRRRRWRGKLAVRDAVHANRRRIRQPRGRRLLRQRGERLGRPHAHLYETGRLPRVHLPRHADIRKRLLVHAFTLNLGLPKRRLAGFSTPPSLQGRARAPFHALQRVPSRFWRLVSPADALVARRTPGPSSVGATMLSHLRSPFSLHARPLSTAF